jgi:hypothetical protein
MSGPFFRAHERIRPLGDRLADVRCFDAEVAQHTVVGMRKAKRN